MFTNFHIYLFDKLFFEFDIGYILIELNQIFPMKPSELKISLSVESYDEKPDENEQNCYVAEKRIVSKLSEKYWSQMQIGQTKNFNEDCVKILVPMNFCLMNFLRKKYVTVGSDRVRYGYAESGWFIVLNDSAGPRMVMKIFFNFF